MNQKNCFVLKEIDATSYRDEEIATQGTMQWNASACIIIINMK
jgi:hypothetical protein